MLGPLVVAHTPARPPLFRVNGAAVTLGCVTHWHCTGKTRRRDSPLNLDAGAGATAITGPHLQYDFSAIVEADSEDFGHLTGIEEKTLGSRTEVDLTPLDDPDRRRDGCGHAGERRRPDS